MSMTKTILASVLGVAIAVGIGVSYVRKNNPDVAKKMDLVSGSKVTLKGLITSEKEAFFKDPEVIKLFEKNGFDIQYERWASGKIAQAKSTAEFGEYKDFVFPPGIQTATAVQKHLKGKDFQVFYSPMVIGSWEPIESILFQNGFIQRTDSVSYLDMEKFLIASSKKVRWKDLKGSEAYPVSKVISVGTTDATTSNSSKMFISLASYVFNGNEMVTTQEQSDKVIPSIRQMMVAQGSRPTSSTNMIQDYMVMGAGKAPMIFLYEQEWLTETAKSSRDLNGAKMKMIYPKPTIFTKHIMIGFNPEVEKFVDFLNTNPDIRAKAVQYGFRQAGKNDLVESNRKSVSMPANILDVIDPPTYDTLDYITQAVEAK